MALRFGIEPLGVWGKGARGIQWKSGECVLKIERNSFYRISSVFIRFICGDMSLHFLCV